MPVPRLAKALDSSFCRSNLQNDLSLKKASKLKYLDLTGSNLGEKNLEEILSSCYSLKKLSLAFAQVTAYMMNKISMQNADKLQVLNLSYR